jgi:hypothetical protein
MRVVAHATFPAKPYVTGRRVLFFRGLRRPLRYEARQFQSTRFCHRHALSCFTATPPQQLPRLHSTTPLLHYTPLTCLFDSKLRDCDSFWAHPVYRYQSQ